jgi:hypothetical protein
MLKLETNSPLCQRTMHIGKHESKVPHILTSLHSHVNISYTSPGLTLGILAMYLLDMRLNGPKDYIRQSMNVHCKAKLSLLLSLLN